MHRAAAALLQGTRYKVWPKKRDEMNGIIDDKPLTLNYCSFFWAVRQWGSPCLDYDEVQVPFPNLELYCVASTNGLTIRYHLSFGQN